MALTEQCNTFSRYWTVIISNLIWYFLQLVRCFLDECCPERNNFESKKIQLTPAFHTGTILFTCYMYCQKKTINIPPNLNTTVTVLIKECNPFMHNVVKWPNVLQKSCGVKNTARFLKYVCLFYNIIHESVKYYFEAF